MALRRREEGDKVILQKILDQISYNLFSNPQKIFKYYFVIFRVKQ
jgi:hypothetical protein